MKKFNTKVLAYAGVLIAMNVILVRLVAINIGPTLRITVGSVPIILGSFWFGPVIGGICGGVGDLIGSILSGYAPNPLILCSSVLTGVLPWFFRKFVLKGISSKSNKMEMYGNGLVRMMLVLGVMHLVTSQGITTYGLSLMYGTDFWPLFLTRLPQSIFLTIVNGVLLILLYASPVTAFVTNSIKQKTPVTTN